MGASLASCFVLLASMMVQAHAIVLVSNAGQIVNGSTLLTDARIAQGFTTGSNANGYTLTNIKLYIPPQGSNSLTSAVLREGDLEGRIVADLTVPSSLVSGLNTFTPTSPTVLQPSTTYYAIFASEDLYVSITSSTDEDSAGQSGWTLADGSRIGPLYYTYAYEPVFYPLVVLEVNGQARSSTTPSAPQALRAASGNNQAVLSWLAPSSSNGSAIARYEYRYKSTGDYPDDWTSAGNNLEETVIGLTNSTNYTFELRASNSSGGGTASTTTVTPEANNTPTYTTPSSFSINEEQTTVGTVIAGDSDSEDNIVGYAIQGGVDSGKFTITNDGALTFLSAPSYEDPQDLTSSSPFSYAGDNQYVVTVEVTSGVSARQRVAYQTIIVTIDDINELPPNPNTPTLTPFSGTSLLVVWTESASNGPYIDDYDYRYRQSGIGWVTVDSTLIFPRFGGPILSVSGLTPNTSYEVQVRAKNPEGTGGWSPTGTGFTLGPPSNLVATPSNGQIKLTWETPTNNNSSDIEGYQYRYKASEDANYPTEWTTAASGLMETVINLVNGTTYNFQVRATVVPRGTGPEATVNSAPILNSPPTFTSSDAFFAPESQTSVGTLVAEDPDSNDNITGYAISGGADSDKFSIANDDLLTFNTAPDFEDPQDSDGNNTYIVTVTATSGTADRVMSAEQTITVTVTDGAEAPSLPQNLSVTPNEGGITLSWEVPANDNGSVLEGYQYRYKASEDANYPTEWTTVASGLTQTVDNLKTDGTIYNFQVRATSSAGPGLSAIANGTPIPNFSPTFTTSSTFQIEEKKTLVGTVQARDADPQDDIVSYAVSGGADSNKFSLTDDGRLTFNTAPSYQDPQSVAGTNSYMVMVTTTSGTGVRELTAEQSITVEVINNSTKELSAWLTRFGRATADQILNTVEERLRAYRSTGITLHFAGQHLPTHLTEDPQHPTENGVYSDSLLSWLTYGTKDQIQSQNMTEQELLMNSSFDLSAGNQENGFASLWGRMSQSTFQGYQNSLQLDGDITTGLLGADYTRGPWTAGLILSRSKGKGNYQGDTTGKAKASLNSLTPWAAYTGADQLSIWAATGYGKGDISLIPQEGSPQKTDIKLLLAALGTRGTLLDPSTGPRIELFSDARWVQTTSKSTTELKATQTHTARLRLGLEGSWYTTLSTGSVLIPRLTLGLRKDSGDAETGFGTDIGTHITLAMPQGLTLSLEARGLLSHQAKGFQDQGWSGTLQWDSKPDSEQGFTLSLSQSKGAASSGGTHALFAHETLEQLTLTNTDTKLIQANIAYGLPPFGNQLTARSELTLGLSDTTRQYSLAWHVSSSYLSAQSFDLSLQGTRHESIDGALAPRHSLGIQLGRQW